MQGLSNIFLLLIVLAFGCNTAKSQINYTAPLEHYSQPKALKKHKVKSLVIFAEMNENDISKRGSVTGKLEELEFNSQGLVAYRLRSDNRGGPPFIAYGKGCYFHKREYDKLGNLTHLIY